MAKRWLYSILSIYHIYEHFTHLAETFTCIPTQLLGAAHTQGLTTVATTFLYWLHENRDDWLDLTVEPWHGLVTWTWVGDNLSVDTTWFKVSTTHTDLSPNRVTRFGLGGFLQSRGSGEWLKFNSWQEMSTVMYWFISKVFQKREAHFDWNYLL